MGTLHSLLLALASVFVILAVIINAASGDGGRVAINTKSQVVRHFDIRWKQYGPAALRVARHLPYYDINWSGTGHKTIPVVYNLSWKFRWPGRLRFQFDQIRVVRHWSGRWPHHGVGTGGPAR